MTARVKTGFCLDEEVLEALRERAARLRVSQGELVREALELLLLHVTDHDSLYAVREARMRAALERAEERALDLREEREADAGVA